MKKITFGTPEKVVPTLFCKTLSYQETPVAYDISKISFQVTARGCLLELPLEPDEQVYGLGLQLKGFNHKGHKKFLRPNSDPVANTGDSHAPVPFFVTNKGYGIFIDTARYVTFYCGFDKGGKPSSPQKRDVGTSTTELYAKKTAGCTTMAIDIPTAKGVDLYIFEGKTITEIVSQYNMLGGGGCSVPEWGLGVFYRCYTKYHQDQVLELARYFRENDIPCDILGLEPGWQTHAYSCTYVWNPERYPHYREMIQSLRDDGFHVNLWEHAFIDRGSPLYEPMEPYVGDYRVWNGLIPDFSLPEAREVFAGYHRKYLVDAGIDGFKLDECDNGDYVNDWSFPDCTQFPSGIDGELYHSLFGVLYMQTALQALEGVPTLSEVRNAGALSSSYPFVLYSDLYDHQDFIRGMVNSGFSGILWTPEVREGNSRKDFIRRVQTVVFSTQCLINAWYLEKAPWLEWDCEEEIRTLLKEREKLVPMLKAAFDCYHQTGKPPVRALVMDYTDDPETYQIDDQYLFCENLLVAPMTEAHLNKRKVYLPAGEWVDYWTGESVSSGWFEVETEQIPVYRRIR